MTFREYDNVKTLENICKKSGSQRVKKTASYLGVSEWQNRGSGKFTAEIVDDVGFYAGVFCKNHFNLIECAVLEEYHGKGIGSALAKRIKQRCLDRGINKIKLRTSINETAVDFWQKQGAVITGLKEDDYTMEINI